RGRRETRGHDHGGETGRPSAGTAGDDPEDAATAARGPATGPTQRGPRGVPGVHPRLLQTPKREEVMEEEDSPQRHRGHRETTERKPEERKEDYKPASSLCFVFSVHSLCPLCLCGEISSRKAEGARCFTGFFGS